MNFLNTVLFKEGVEGIIINPFGDEPFRITKDMIKQWADKNYPYKYKFPDEDYTSYLWRPDWWNMNPIFRFNYIRFDGANAGKAGIRYKKEYY